MTDELRRRLAASDPLRDVAIDPVDSDRARTLLEAIMSDTDLAQRHDDAHTASTPRSPRRRWLPAAAAALVAVAAIAVVAVVVRDDDAPAGPSGPALALALPGGDTMAMCLPVDVAIMQTAEVAFAGTVATAGDGVVRIDVDRWYRGGDAAIVEMSTPAGFVVALDGVDFVAGQRFLVTATAGQVLGCGMSGPASAELEQLFDAAFAGG